MHTAEKRNRKRMAEVGAVYDLAPVPSIPPEVLASKVGDNPPPALRVTEKWVTASEFQRSAHAWRT